MIYEKFLVGYKKSGEEILVSMIDGNSYVDLIAKEPINKDEIDLASLKLFDVKSNLKSSIVKRYKKSRNEILETDKFIVGRHCEAKNVINKPSIFGKSYKLCEWTRKFLSSELFICEYYLDPTFSHLDYFMCQDLDENTFWACRLTNKNECYLAPFENGYRYVLLEENTLKDLTGESFLSRKEINEYNYHIKSKTLSVKKEVIK